LITQVAADTYQCERNARYYVIKTRLSLGTEVVGPKKSLHIPYSKPVSNNIVAVLELILFESFQLTLPLKKE